MCKCTRTVLRKWLNEMLSVANCHKLNETQRLMFGITIEIAESFGMGNIREFHRPIDFNQYALAESIECA